jgi:hypothetical protein
VVTDQMTKIFLDTEFLDDGRRIEPVSLALVSQAQAEYYAICADSDITQITAHPWLRAHVVPHLPITVTPGRLALGHHAPRPCSRQTTRADRHRSPRVPRPALRVGDLGLVLPVRHDRAVPAVRPDERAARRDPRLHPRPPATAIRIPADLALV